MRGLGACRQLEAAPPPRVSETGNRMVSADVAIRTNACCEVLSTTDVDLGADRGAGNRGIMSLTEIAAETMATEEVLT